MHRLKRVGVPLLIGAFTIVPLQSLWWLFTHRGDVDSGVIVWTVLLGWLWSLHHLWFLWVLLLLVVIFVALTAVGAKFSDRRIWWLLIPLVLVPQLLMTEPTWGPDTSTQLWTNPVVLVYHGVFLHVRSVHVPDRNSDRQTLGIRARAGDADLLRRVLLRVR